MTQALNFTVKAIEGLLSHQCPDAPATRAAFRYLADKLRQAQVFVLSDHGQLLDRSKPRPEVPGLLLRPPFPVIALEYTARGVDWEEGFYTAAKCSKRIALAWEWTDDLPAELRGWCPPRLGQGVVVASIPFYDAQGLWVPVPAAMHIAFDDAWQAPPAPYASPFRTAMLESGRLTRTQLEARTLAGSVITLSPETIAGLGVTLGPSCTVDTLAADTMDEVNAYADLCYALACKNVGMREHPAPAALNKQRIKAGKLPLKGFHVLEVQGGGEMPGAGAVGDRSAPRSHLRRGHIRRLARDRVTWVNSTVVRGRGFVDKVYAA